MEIRDLNISDVKKVAEVHEKSFKDFFLTSLGRHFLETYYAASINNNKSIGIGLFDNEEKLYGFATGTSKSLGYHKTLLLQNSFLFFKSLLLVSLNRPKVIFRLFKNINKKSDKKDDKQYAELLSIAILPDLKGSGYGKVLLDEFEKKAKFHQASKIALTTDYNNNDNVIKFYNKSGYEVYYDFIAYPNRHMYKLIKKLDEKDN
ncbi:GNAT family N-acetyltransferase [Flavobacterium denitrificans]|uniref:GNAT family N-acetyltransferase n=1 Tax=Flavobacterium denitrificans TaxID=281361 RepID=UPI0004193D74|nr:GNAT family N-acetyltransferase [Flavobacterium denitrificans]